MNIVEINKQYHNKVGLDIGRISFLKIFKEGLDILHLNIKMNYKLQWNLFFTEPELDDVIEYIETGKLIRPEIWTSNNPLVKYRWTKSANEVFLKHIKKLILVELGDEHTLEENEKARVRYGNRLRDSRETGQN
jgi:hypothetical protein